MSNGRVARVPSAFASAETHAVVAAGVSSSSYSASWVRPELLKLPSQTRSEQHHHAPWSTIGEASNHELHTPVVDQIRCLQGQFSHPVQSPAVLSMRSKQEGQFRSPLASPEISATRKQDGSFQAPPNTPEVVSVRSIEASFRLAPVSDQLELLRQQHEDPFRPSWLDGQCSSGSQYGVSSNEPEWRHLKQRAVGQDAVLRVRQQMDGFRSETITPKLAAIRQHLESFASDQTELDPVRAAIARSSEDPFGSQIGAQLSKLERMATLAAPPVS